MNDNPSQAARVAVAWTIVGIPLVYGLYNAVKAAAQLFTG
ncbi:MFS transporter small subunit [Pimelobacter simplex]